ncbi:MAG: hypothetical protein AAB011_11355, partial [Candidatus Eisenbacteria bacterium]
MIGSTTPHTRALVPSIAVTEVSAQDPAGRQWVVLVTSDNDPTGGTVTVQYPDLLTANVAGLNAGSWSVRAESRLLLTLLTFSGSTRTDF